MRKRVFTGGGGLCIVMVVIGSGPSIYRGLERDTAAAAVTARQSADPAQSFRDCSTCPEMVAIPGGTFLMGSPDTERGRYDTEGPQRRVTIRPFAAGKYDVTRGQWAGFVAATKGETVTGCAFTGRVGNRFDPTGSWQNLGFPQDDSHPVVCVSWDEAQAYARWLSRQTGRRYRLLTEAEWEYAARAGTTTPFPWGTETTHDHANYGADDHFNGLAQGRDRWVNTSPVGAFPANDFGLHDMHGNVLQWVQDCYASYTGLPTDGSAYETAVVLKEGAFPWMAGTNACAYRMLRGGDWGNPPRMIRSAFRNFAPPENATLVRYRSGGVGFRVARAVD